MKSTFKLKDLIDRGETAIAATSTLIGQGMVAIASEKDEHSLANVPLLTLNGTVFLKPLINGHHRRQ